MQKPEGQDNSTSTDNVDVKSNVSTSPHSLDPEEIDDGSTKGPKHEDSKQSSSSSIPLSSSSSAITAIITTSAPPSPETAGEALEDSGRERRKALSAEQPRHRQKSNSSFLSLPVPRSSHMSNIEDYSKALREAAQRGSLLEVDALIRKGAVVSSKGSAQRTALHLAAAQGHMKVVDLLLDSHADAGAKDSLGRTPLHIAALFDYPMIGYSLVCGGCPVNAVDNRYDTALSFAIETGSLSFVRLLVAARADLNLLNAEGLTPLDQAAHSHTNRTQIRQLLTQYGALRSHTLRSSNQSSSSHSNSLPGGSLSYSLPPGDTSPPTGSQTSSPPSPVPALQSIRRSSVSSQLSQSPSRSNLNTPSLQTAPRLNLASTTEPAGGVIVEDLEDEAGEAVGEDGGSPSSGSFPSSAAGTPQNATSTLTPTNAASKLTFINPRGSSLKFPFPLGGLSSDKQPDKEILSLDSWFNAGPSPRFPPTAKRSLDQLQKAGMADTERVNKLIMLQKSFGMNTKAINLLDNPWRRLLFLGYVQCDGMARRVIIFEDLMVLAAPQRMGAGLDIKACMPLTPALAMKDMPDRKGKNLQNRVKLVTPQKTHMLVAKNATDKARLVSAFQTALQEFYIPPYDNDDTVYSTLRRISRSLSSRGSESHAYRYSNSLSPPPKIDPAKRTSESKLTSDDHLLAQITGNEERLAALRALMTQEEAEIASLRFKALELRAGLGSPAMV
eukprot:g28198.t1